jgi:pimeloyl-ACP methyl ester carboxylesterase
LLAYALDSLLNRGGTPDATAWPAGTRLLQTARGKVRVRDTGGRGPAVLMVPDGPNVIEHHTAVIGALAPHARVICFDLPGFGFSRPTFGYSHSVEHGAQAVLAVMDTLELREASLFFSCANGFYAIAAAKRVPQRIRRLLLCQTPGLSVMPAWTLRNVPRPIRTPVLGQLLMRAARRKFAHTWYGMAMPPDQPSRPQRAEFRATADRALTQGGCFCLAGVVQGLTRAQESDVAGVKTPATLLWGDADRSHKHTRAESLLELLPQATIRHFPDCGHFPDLEQPQRYSQIALSVLHS